MVPENFTSHLPESEVAGVFAVGTAVSSNGEIVTLDFLADLDESNFQVVRRIRLAPSALEGLYLELGQLIEKGTGFRPGPK